MGSNKWRLGNSKKQNGQLNQTKEFLDAANKLRCSLITVPVSINEKTAIIASSGIVGTGIRSFELWWDGQKRELSLVLVAEKYDLDSFKQSFYNMYPNAGFTDIGVITPGWFDKNEDYQIFDIGTYHGHYAAVFDQARAHQIISQISNTIQISKFAWIQFTFKSHNFTKFFLKHVAQLNKKFAEISSKKYVSTKDLIVNPYKVPGDHPELRSDFYNNYNTLLKHSTAKMQGSHALMSIRGLIASDQELDLNFDEIESMSIENIISNHERLTKYKYRHGDFFTSNPKKEKHIKIGKNKTKKQRIDIFPSRLLPDPVLCIYDALDVYFKKGIFGYHDRKPLPFLILNPSEIPLFIHLPTPTTPNIKTTRSAMIPQQRSGKMGIQLGLFKRGDATALGGELGGIFGQLVKSSDAHASVVSTDDFSRHMYAVGATGTGKTSLIRLISKHLEMLNLDGKFPNSFIYLDPKGDDSFRFFQQCQKESIDAKHVHFLDPNLTKFSINPLELPLHIPQEREQVVSRYVGYFMEIVREWYGQNQVFVQMERIFRALLYYLYTGNDAPTFLDIHNIVTRIQEDGEDVLQEIFHSIGKPDSEMKQALESIASLRGDSFTPLLNRVEQFATDPILKQIFCVPHGTVNFTDLISPGHYTVVRVSALNIPHHVQPLAIQAFIIKLWFTIQERATKVPDEKDRTQVVLALDEFQIVKDLQVLPLILSHARSYRLGLILAHQTTAQINDKLLEEITGNCGTQFAGKVSGRDARRIAQIWDPQFSKEIQQQLASQEDFHWTIKMRADPGIEQPAPAQFWLHHPPKLNMDDKQRDEFIEAQRQKYGCGIVEGSFLNKAISQNIRWYRNLQVEFQEKSEWYVLLILRHDTLNLKSITEQYLDGTTARDQVKKILRSLMRKKLVICTDSRKALYTISKQAHSTYFDYSFEDIGTANDIELLASDVAEMYLKKKHFVAVANQKVKKGKLRTDLVAYHYESDTPISIEIESYSEVESHPEHVLLNMKKWPELGFKRCHIWSRNPKLQRIYDAKLSDKEKKLVTALVYKPMK